MKKIILICLLASGCASGPLVDPKSSKTPENFYADRTECEAISQEVSFGWEMTKSAVIQGLLGAAIASVAGGQPPEIGAASGALAGAGTGAWNTKSTRADIVTKCLQGRGYTVLK
jgi:hypothetical protein